VGVHIFLILLPFITLLLAFIGLHPIVVVNLLAQSLKADVLGISSTDSIELEDEKLNYKQLLKAVSEESGIRVVLSPDCPGLINDPRTTKLFALAEELGFSGKHVALMQEIHRQFSEAKNKQITLNAVGAIGAVIPDMKLHYSIVKSFAVAARAVGLIGILLKKSKLDAKTAWDRNS
jgi:hypothetical protein